MAAQAVGVVAEHENEGICMVGMTDSRGQQSKTLTFVTVAYVVATAKFALAGLTPAPGWAFPAMTGGEYASMVVAILGIWLGREWQARQ